MTLPSKDNLFNLRLDDETRDKLDELASRTQRTRASLIRWLIDEAHKNVIGQPAPLPFDVLTAEEN